MTASPSKTPAHQVFALAGRQIEQHTSSSGQRILAAAHAAHLRPMCLCTPGGVEMYIARLALDRYVVKRMPHTGPLHARGCASYPPHDPDRDYGRHLGGAARESADTGITALRLGFRISTTDRAAPTRQTRSTQPFTATGPRLTLQDLLHHLWSEAGLTTWSPAMATKRNWGVVSWHLRHAATGKFVTGQPLSTRLFVPEPFRADRKAELAARRLKAWAPARSRGRVATFMILVGEVKTIMPARPRHKLIVKHLPDAPFLLDEHAHRQLRQAFRAELDLRRADEEGHLIAIATFSADRAGRTRLQEIALMMTDQHWLPYTSSAEKALLDLLTEQQRRFVKRLPHGNVDASKHVPSLTFTDTDVPVSAYLVDRRDVTEELSSHATGTATPAWTWDINDPPPLPPTRQTRHASHAPGGPAVPNALSTSHPIEPVIHNGRAALPAPVQPCHRTDQPG